MKKLLSALAVPKLGTGEYWDPLIPGLALRVGARRRTWTLRHRVGGRHRRDILGYFPTLSLADARTAAGKLLERVEAGATPLPPPVHPRSALTLGALIDRYEALRHREGHRIKQLAPSMRALRVGLADYLRLPATQFSKADLRAARDAIADRGTLIAANRLLGYLGPVFKWAAQEDLIPTNFVRDLRRAPERKRSHVLTDKEIAGVWHACNHRGEWPAAKAYGRLVRFLLCTAQRRDEAASLKYGDILDGTWKQADNKAGRPHSLKLPRLALDLVGKGQARDLVFGGASGGKLVGFSKLKRALDREATVSGWRLHDLRRTAATRMQVLGIRNEIVQAVLNHAIPGVGGVYLRAELEKEKAEALRVWATELERITGKTRRAVS
jgi:integrase